MNEHGRCMEMLSEKTSREDCCGQYPGVSTAWSSEDLESGSLFFYRALGGGVRCFACKGVPSFLNHSGENTTRKIVFVARFCHPEKDIPAEELDKGL